MPPASADHPLTVGLTGGVASGKSVLAECFAALGVPVLDADRVAREVVEPGSEALRQIARRFGERMLRADGTLDRRALRSVVFTDTTARRDLEAILHPLIGARIRQWRDARTEPYCMVMTPLLVESERFRALVDHVLVVDVPEAIQIRRLTQRDQIDEALARAMLAAQASRDERLSAADDVVDNSGDPAVLTTVADTLHENYLGMVRNRSCPPRALRLP